MKILRKISALLLVVAMIAIAAVPIDASTGNANADRIMGAIRTELPPEMYAVFGWQTLGEQQLRFLWQRQLAR